VPEDLPGIDKASLRRRLVAARAAMSDSERTAAGRLIRDNVLELPQVAAAGTIAAYYSVGTEPDTRGLVFALWKRGSYVILPVLLPDGDLDWASYEGPDSLAPGPLGLLQPVEPVRGPEAVARAHVILVPALGVDSRGNRLGRGAGSYDRALARVHGQVPVIALLYDDELLPDLPAQPHDRPVTAVARPAHGVTWLLSPGGTTPRTPRRRPRGFCIRAARTFGGDPPAMPAECLWSSGIASPGGMPSARVSGRTRDFGPMAHGASSIGPMSHRAGTELARWGIGPLPLLARTATACPPGRNVPGRAAVATNRPAAASPPALRSPGTAARRGISAPPGRLCLAVH
jgi:5-formyltetrahydrofolate cyclo-ligase